MTAPGRPMWRETERELAELQATSPDLIGAVFAAELEKANRPVGQDYDGFARFNEIQAEAEIRYREQLRQWEANAPARRAGQLAFERAMRQRQAELGQPVPGQIAAALDWGKPTRPRWIG